MFHINRANHLAHGPQSVIEIDGEIFRCEPVI